MDGLEKCSKHGMRQHETNVLNFLNGFNYFLDQTKSFSSVFIHFLYNSLRNFTFIVD